MNYIARVTTILISLTLSLTLSAQQAQPAADVSDQELQQCASAFVQLQQVEQQAQQEMSEAVEESNLGIERFNEIYLAQQDADMDAEVTSEEQDSFNEIGQMIAVIQQQAQQEMAVKIEDEGLSITRYQEIMAAIQGDPELQVKFQSHLE